MGFCAWSQPGTIRSCENSFSEKGILEGWFNQVPFETGREVVTEEGLQLNEAHIQLLVAAASDCRGLW